MEPIPTIFKFIEDKHWSEALKAIKKYRKELSLNPDTFDIICINLENAFLENAKNRDDVLVIDVAQRILGYSESGYFRLSRKNREEIEGIISISTVNETDIELSLEKQTISVPRVDWLQPLFKSKQEKVFYSALKEVFPTFFIYPNVALKNIFDKSSIEPYVTKNVMDFWWKGVVDFVVYDPQEDLAPKYFFELDSFHHDSADGITRDEKKNAIFEVANIPLYRVRNYQKSLTLKHEFMTEVRQLIKNS